VIAQIPRRIIQTGKSRDLSLLCKAAVANVTLLNPNYEYLFFDDADVQDFIDKEFPEYRSVFDEFSVPIQRFDFFRYLAVYRLGGFYFDLDVFLAANLDELLPFSCVFPFEELTIHRFLRRRYDMDWEIGNYAFAAEAGHPFLRAVIDNCIKAQREPDWIQPMMRDVPAVVRNEYFVLNTTGPGLLSRTLAEYQEAATQIKVLFPENVCDERYWHRFGTYGVHLQVASWRQRRSYIRRRLSSLWELLLIKQLRKDSLKLGPQRSIEGLRRSS
jgi:inositol phosphorylceramide mannosyltransferase catalytic subunit